MREFLTGLDWSPLWISLKTGAVAAFLCFFLGIFAARKIMKMKKGRARAFLDGILTLPMVLPPTVAGFFLLLVFSRRRPLGSFLEGAFDIKVVQSWAGLTAMRSYALATMDVERAGQDSVSKLLWANWHRSLGELAMDVIGKPGMVMADGEFAEQRPDRVREV